MQVTKKQMTDTKVRLALAAEAELLAATKHQTLRQFAKEAKIQGFRPGKAPLELVEKHIDPSRLQAEFAQQVINKLYSAALDQEKLRPVAQPDISITKFVPFDALEITAEVEVVGDIKLPDYKKIKLSKPKVSVEAKEIDEVLAGLRTRDAEKRDVDRAAKNGDQVGIDFTGVDAKTKEPIKGADGKDYPLSLGSNTFIPGFETNLVGAKLGEERTFVLTFPKDYGVTALQNRKVQFTVTVKKVQEVIEPKLDDAFAAKIGPFKTMTDLKDDIKKELQARKQADADQQFADELVTKIAEKTKVAIPPVLVDEQIERIEREQRQNLLYRGQTWPEFLAAEGLTDQTYRDKQRPAAELRVKAGLALSEIAEQEGIAVTTAELNAQLQALKSQYPDQQMQAELAKPEARRTIASRLLTQKTVDKLTSYVSPRQ